MGAMGVVVSKNIYEQGTPEYDAFEAGVEAERIRLNKVLAVYHKRFGSGELKESETAMQIKYMYDYVNESRTLK